MKKLLFLLAFVPFLLIGQQPATQIDLSEYHDDNRLMEMVDANFDVLYNTPVVGVYFADSAVTIALDSGDWEYVTNATFNLWTGNASGLSVSVASGDSITIIEPGDYIANISLTFSGTADDTIQMAVFKNAVATPERIEAVPIGLEQLSFTLPVMMFGMVADDDMSIRIRNISTDNDIVVRHGSAYMFMLKPD